jgi:hypothetical protein
MTLERSPCRLTVRGSIEDVQLVLNAVSQLDYAGLTVAEQEVGDSRVKTEEEQAVVGGMREGMSEAENEPVGTHADMCVTEQGMGSVADSHGGMCTVVDSGEGSVADTVVHSETVVTSQLLFSEHNSHRVPTAAHQHLSSSTTTTIANTTNITTTTTTATPSKAKTVREFLSQRSPSDVVKEAPPVGRKVARGTTDGGVLGVEPEEGGVRCGVCDVWCHDQRAVDSHMTVCQLFSSLFCEQKMT